MKTQVKKEITVSEFRDVLKKRIAASKEINCCKEEIERLADMAAEHMGDKKIMVYWMDD